MPGGGLVAAGHRDRGLGGAGQDGVAGVVVLGWVAAGQRRQRWFLPARGRHHSRQRRRHERFPRRCRGASWLAQSIQIRRITVEPARHGAGELDTLVTGVAQGPVGQLRCLPATPAHVQAMEVESPGGQRQGAGHLEHGRLGELGQRGLRVAAALGEHAGAIGAACLFDIVQDNGPS